MSTHVTGGPTVSSASQAAPNELSRPPAVLNHFSLPDGGGRGGEGKFVDVGMWPARSAFGFS